jgi:hypothetical protein
MQPILDFIDRYAIDPHIYVVATQPSGGGRFELFWDRETTEHWRIRPFGTTEWRRHSSAQLISALRSLDVDLDTVERQLRTVALTQVVFAETLTAEAREVFGAESVQRALIDHAAFLEDLRRIVMSFTRNTLRPIPGGGEASASRSGHLSVVPPATSSRAG